MKTAPFAGAASPIGGVSLWDVQAPGRVRVWFAPFLHMPSDAMTYDFELRGGRWVWHRPIDTVIDAGPPERNPVAPMDSVAPMANGAGFGGVDTPSVAEPDHRRNEVASYANDAAVAVDPDREAFDL